jgi:hypothetical protein
MSEQPLLLISEAAEVEKLNQLFSVKKQVIPKKMPSFTHRFLMTNGDKKSNWLYSNNGYVMSENDPQKTIYKIETNLINRLLSEG